MGKALAPFLKAWCQADRTFKDSQWGFHSSLMPYRTHISRPRMESHEVNTFVTANFPNMKKLFYDRFLNWKCLRGSHRYTRFFMKYFQGRYEQQISSLG
ncbi:hypothetical protein ACOMHN_029426 [Nucella lapillus]